MQHLECLEVERATVRMSIRYLVVHSGCCVAPCFADSLCAFSFSVQIEVRGGPKNQPASLFRKYSSFFCSRELFPWGTQPHYFELFY